MSKDKLQVHVTTLGCSKNLYDSEILLGQLKANKADIIEEPENADVLIVNTCGFITPAKQESIDAILEAGKYKAQNPDMKLLVCGCLSERYMPDLKRDIPEVDGYFGTEDYNGILKYLDLQADSPDHLYEKRVLSQESHFAYLKISEGCNHKCAFCAIPLIRGKHRSRRMSEIIKEAEMLAQNGVKEIILIAQDTTFYGLDLYKEQRIIQLIQELEKIEGIEWIRLHYAYPTTFQSELVDVMAHSKKLVPYLDLPVQHISDKMLKIMKRGGTASRIKEILTEMRQRIPNVAMRTTFIVGHPGETEEDFEILKDFVKEFKFDRLGAFVYSPEENTSAFPLEYPEKEIAEQRYAELMEIQQKISFEKNQQKIGGTQKVLIDEVNSELKTAVGRTYADSPEIDNEVIIENPSISLKPGDLFDVEIIDAGEYELFAKI